MKQRNAAKTPVNKQYDYLIGIDPGTNTGFVSWNVKEQKFEYIETTSIHDAMFQFFDANPNEIIKVYIEDSRNVSRGFGGAAKAQGAGSIKRDCNIWEDFLKDLGIDYQFIRPNKKSMLKMDDKAFRALTGWDKRTSNHARDAAMLVFGRTN